jgi:hypothetical protein
MTGYSPANQRPSDLFPYSPLYPASVIALTHVQTPKNLQVQTPKISKSKNSKVEKNTSQKISKSKKIQVKTFTTTKLY